MDKPSGFHPALIILFFFLPATFAEPVSLAFPGARSVVVSPDILKKQGKNCIDCTPVSKRVKDDGVSTLPQQVKSFHNL